MMMQELLDILCCPHCKGDLAHSESAQTLTCRTCGRTYPIKNDIPIMLTEETGGE